MSNCKDLDKRTKAYKDCIKNQSEGLGDKAIDKGLSYYKGDEYEKQFNKEIEDELNKVGYTAIEERGFGDVVEEFTKKTGIKKLVEFFTPEGKDCGCDKRKAKLNDLFPVRRKPIRCFDETQYKQYQSFVETRTLNLWNESDITLLINLYAHVFAVQYNNRDLCRSCSGSAKILFRMTEELDKVYETYKPNDS